MAVMRTNAPSHIACAVVHNKLKKKEAQLPEGVIYMAGEDVPNRWNCYPWDAAAYGRDIWQHEDLAAECAGSKTSGFLSSGAPLLFIMAGVTLGFVLARRSA